MRPVSSAGSSAADWARLSIESGEVPTLSLADALKLAWALKDACFEGWSSEPQRAVKAAELLCVVSQRETARRSPHADEVAALAAWTSGVAAVTGGRLDDAVLAFDRARSAFLTLGQTEHAAATQVPRIMALSMLGRYDEAIACGQAAQAEFLALGDRHAAARVMINLGGMHLLRGKYAESARYSREATVMFARAGDHERSISADINLARALTYLGDFDEATRVFARARMRSAAHAFPVLQAIVEDAAAFLRLARGQFAEALAGFEDARRRYEQLEMTQELAVAEKQLADAYAELRLLPEALALLDQSIARFKTLGRGDEEAWALAQHGRVLTMLGKANAAESFVQAASLFASHGNASGEAAVLLARAELALTSSEAGAALDLAARAGRIFAEAGQIDSRLRADVVRAYALQRAGSIEQARSLFHEALSKARELGLLSTQVRALTGLGITAQGAGDSQEALQAFTDAVALFEEQRRALPDAAIRSAFLCDHLRPYQELMRLAIDEHARLGTVASAAHVLRRLDRYRARALGERVTQGAERIESVAAQGLRSRVNWLYATIERCQRDGQGTIDLADELRKAEHELLEGSRRERLTASGSGGAHDDDDLDVLALQRALGERDAVVEYGVLDDELFACIVRADGVAVHRRLARWSDVLEALRSARFQIESLRHGAAPVEHHLQQLIDRARTRLRRLHALVWQPLAPALNDCARILIIPHAQLGSAPFAALEDAQGCLAERHRLAVVPSARLALRGLQRPPSALRKAFVLGESTRLAHAAQEAHAVAKLLGSATLATGKEATMATLRDHAGRADVIHLACHAQFRGDNPVFSALHLYDAALTVDLVETLGLGPSIVVLSGCETGLADAGGGDEMVGLVRAFLIAGASRVVASLWPVDDAVTAGFMTHFYRGLRAGEAAADALAYAQREVIKQYPHPLHWAAFTLYGGW